MIIRACPRSKTAWEIIFDFTILKGHISRCGTKRPMKYTMLQQNKDEKVAHALTRIYVRTAARPRAHGGSPVLPSACGYKGVFGSGQEAKTKKYVATKSYDLVELSFGQNINRLVS